MSDEEFPLVWWWRKELPHRTGQRCRQTDSRHGGVALRKLVPEPWEAPDSTYRLFEFEDGTREWGPPAGARRPNRPWKDAFEHERDHCTGHWRRIRGGYCCRKCHAYVRDGEEAKAAYEAASRMDMAIHGIVRENKWAEFIAAVAEGMPPLRLAEWIMDLRLAWPHVTGYAEAMRSAGVEVEWDYVRAISNAEPTP